MTQIRPRIDDDLAAEVQAYADAYGISFADAVRILLRTGLANAGRRSTQRLRRRR